MTIRIYDPTILTAQGALVDFAVLRRQFIAAGRAFDDRKRRSLLLRWQTSPAVGLPTEPFKVWQRPATPLGDPHPVGFQTVNFPGLTGAGDLIVIQFAEPLASVTINVRTNSTGVLLFSLCGPPLFESINGMAGRNLPGGGAAEFTLQAPMITGLMLRGVGSFDPPRGLTRAELDKIDNWQLVETVGLPVDEGAWAPLGQRHGVKQGLVGAEMPAKDAAIDRFSRGINPYGWLPTLPGGTPAPLWERPDPALLVDEAAMQLLPMLRQIAAAAPQDQAAQTFNFTIQPPQNPAGDIMPASNPGTAVLSPIGLLAMTAGSDPMLAVTLGYGTGYPDVDIPTIVFGKGSFFGDSSRSDWDWLITGRWETGLDGRSDPVEYAALVPRPGMALPAPTPADLRAETQASLRPAASDGDWLASVRASWERFPINQLSNVASFAAARARLGSGGAAEALLEKRALTAGRRPIANARNDRDPEPARQSATDATLPIPNDPGSIAMAYAAAAQTLFGMWSPWVEAAVTPVQPPPAPVQLLSASLAPTDPGSGSACPAILTVEFSVDWRVRSVAQIDLAGALFAAATRSTSPANAFPTALQRQLGGADAALAISFTGDVPSIPGGSIIALNPGGDAEVAPGDAGQGSTRRYRVTLPGFTLDYAATPHIGLALRARLVERLAPGRTGPWSARPVIAYASDPRARATTVIDLVRLASLPDAAGECHAHIDWAGVPGAIGYALYESTETRILTGHPDLPQPTPDRTLTDRLTTLKGAFNTRPQRRDFVRRNPDLITTTSLDITLPRGSRDIHLFTVLPVSPGGIEGPWPSGANPAASLIPIAAPRVAEPAPPTLEVQPLSNRAPAAPDYRARLRITTRPGAGARPQRIDIYRVRVDDAARQLGSMGPPIASLTSSGSGWTIDNAAGWIDSVTGDDRPGGSWRNVWYRAVAWSADDAQRGVLKGRSAASPAVAVLVPPAGPPDLSGLSVSFPGGDPGAALVSFTSAAPLADTPVGPHVISVEALVAGSAALVQHKSSLAGVARVQPATGSGLWQQGGSPTAYHLLLRRAAISDAVAVIVRITDPLGRTSEATLTIAAGSVNPLPSLSAIDMFSIAGRGQVFSFATDAPNSDGAGAAYRIKVELALLARSIRPPRIPPLPLPAGTQFRLIGGVYVATLDLADVPGARGMAGGASLALARQAPPADDQFSLFSSQKLRSIRVTILTPDGRSVVASRRG